VTGILSLCRDWPWKLNLAGICSPCVFNISAHKPGDFLEGKGWFSEHLSKAFDAAFDTINDALRLIGIGWDYFRKARQEIDHGDQENEKYQAGNHDRQDEPDRGDGSPASHVSIVAESGKAGDDDYGNKNHERQKNGQQNLRPHLLAVKLKGWMVISTARGDGFHRLYFNINRDTGALYPYMD
jgi:hypothetical protein